jgi:hypothetical protein
MCFSFKMLDCCRNLKTQINLRSIANQPVWQADSLGQEFVHPIYFPGAGREACRSSLSLKSVVLLPQRIFVSIARIFGLHFGVMHREPGVVPMLHLQHGMIFIGECLFGADRIYPMIRGTFVGSKKVIKININVAHMFAN